MAVFDFDFDRSSAEMIGLCTDSRILECTVWVGVRHKSVVKGCKRRTSGQGGYSDKLAKARRKELFSCIL